jgi:type IV pilus assembly protein PilM
MRIVGIEFGTWSVKAVEMESRFRQVDVLELYEIRLPLTMTNPTQVYAQAVRQLLSHLPTHPEKIVTSLPPAQTALRFLSVPLKARKKVEQMYRFELEDTIPFKLEDALIEHHVTRSKDGSLVFAAVAPKKHVKAHLDWLKGIGLDPDWLTFEGMGFINLYLAQRAEAEEDQPEGPVLILDIGHSKTNLAIMNEDRLEFFRSAAWGGSAVTHSIASSLGLTLEKAEARKIKELDLAGDSEGEKAELISAASPAFVNLMAEIQHSLVSFQNQSKTRVVSAVLTGGTSETRGLTQLMEKSLGVPVRLFHPFSGIKLKDELKGREESHFTESLGRAFVFARKSPLLFNFRKDDLGKETSLTAITTLLGDPNIIKLAAMGGILTAALFLHVSVASYLADREAKSSAEELRKVFSETFRSAPQKLRNSLTSDPDELRKYIEQKHNELNQKLKVVAKNRTPALTVVRSISEAFPTTVKVDVNVLDLTDRNLTLEGVLYEGSLDAVTEALKKIPSFTNITLTMNDKRFTYKGEVTGR